MDGRGLSGETWGLQKSHLMNFCCEKGRLGLDRRNSPGATVAGGLGRGSHIQQRADAGTLLLGLFLERKSCSLSLILGWVSGLKEREGSVTWGWKASCNVN